MVVNCIEYSIPDVFFDRLRYWIVGIDYPCVTDIVAT
ncbi:hypothetical protein ERIC1_10p00150 (plasmid) [Paenibacillus larvae subsp. larvae DSM 25719]|nr:hypothetical protein ERIC1_10p00150 [Paenibacillus larvae subsp. larvae DSM 25719]